MPDQTQQQERESRGQQADFIFRVGELTEQDLRVTAFTGSEGVSRLFEFDVQLCSRDPNVDFQQVVGKSCLLEIVTAAGSRYVNGIVRRFARTGEVRKVVGETARQTYYRAEVVPLQWMLTKRYRSRIFQAHNCEDMSVPGIIKQVFTDAGIPEDMFRFALQEEYEPRDFVVQYRESDMDFLSRLMEHEGIFYFFEHTAEGHVMVFGDSPVANAANPNDAEFPFREPAGLVEQKQYVYAAAEQQEINFGAVSLDDYDFKRPATELRATVAADQYTSLQFSDCPGEYVDKQVGGRYAQVRLEEYQATKHQVDMQSTVRGLIPGYRFTLVEHPAESMNREYLLLSITHEATQPQSSEEQAGAQVGFRHTTRLRAIPADVPYRPPRVTRKPVVVGSQTALVAGPDGEEIYTDDGGYGRVKVQFHWDPEGQHDENSSCWIRVSQGWAGGNYGMIFLPRVGQEVIVNFLEGNPDRPIITGRVYNNDNMPPYKLPDEKTKSTIKSNSSKDGDGFNELRFEDKKDQEQIFLHAQRNLDVRVKNNKYETVENDVHEIVRKNSKRKVEQNDHTKVDGDRMADVGGSDSESVGANQSVSVGANYELQVGANAVQTAGGNFNIDASGQLTIKATKIVLDAVGGITLKAGAGYVDVTPASVATGPATAVGLPATGVPVMSATVPPTGVPLPAVVMGPTSAQDPEEAATGDPGQDYTYEQEREQVDPLENAPTHDEDESNERHWIGIRLFDDNGRPLAGERYVVVLPDGTTVARGRLNHEGEAEIRGIDPGNCQVMFPDLDGATWQPGPPTGGEGGDESAPDAGAPSGLPGGAGGLPGL